MSSVILICSHPSLSETDLIEELAKHGIEACAIEEGSPIRTKALQAAEAVKFVGARIFEAKNVAVIGAHAGLASAFARLLATPLASTGVLIAESMQQALPDISELARCIEHPLDTESLKEEVPFWREIGVNSKRARGSFGSKVSAMKYRSFRRFKIR